MSTEALGESIMALADRIEARDGGPGPDPSLALARDGEDPVVFQLIYSVLLWESCHELAARGVEAVRAGVVDFNELRVCSADEVRHMLPRESPRRDERAARLVDSLNEIFVREHALNLAAVAAMPKREARQYLDAIAALPGFAAARTVLVALGGHAFPADDRIARLLVEAKAVKKSEAEPGELGPRLERAVRAADAPRIYALLEAEAGRSRQAGSRRTARAARSNGHSVDSHAGNES